MTARGAACRSARSGPIWLLLSIVAVGGCASGETQEEKEEREARAAEEAAAAYAEQIVKVQRTRAFLEQTRPTAVPWAHTRGRATLLATNMFFAEIESSAGRYLIETAEECEPLTRAARNARIFLGTGMTIQGSSNRMFRAKKDEIYGCLIEAIYELPDQEPGPDQ